MKVKEFDYDSFFLPREEILEILEIFLRRDAVSMLDEYNKSGFNRRSAIP